MLMLLCVVCMGLTSHAAPGEVTLTKAKAGLSKVTLTWKKAAGAKGYYVYYEKDNGSLKKIATVRNGNKTKITITKLKNNVTYKFCVAAFSGSSTGPVSNVKKATPTVGNPGKLKEVRVLRISSKRVYLRWSTNTKASGYQVFMLNESTGEYELVKNVAKTKNMCMISNLKNGKTYYFKVRAYLKKGGAYGYGRMSATLVGRPVSYATMRKTASVHPYYYKAKMNYAVSSGGVNIPSGASVTVTDLGSSKSKVTYKSQTVKVPTASLTLEDFIVKPSAAPTNEVAENFVNIKGYQSETNYLIWINTYSQHMYVFQGSQYNWKCVKVSPCCTGKLEKPTPLGVSQVHNKKDVVFFTTVSGTAIQGGFWGLRISGGYIHSWLYNITSIVDFDWKTEEIKKVLVPPTQLNADGTGSGVMKWNAENYSRPASSGCIRVPIAFARWMYENVPLDTTNVTH